MGEPSSEWLSDHEAAIAALRPHPLVYVADLDGPELEPEDHHHLARSLRLRAGDPVGLSDGHGRWRLARFGDPVSDLGPIRELDAPTPSLTVGFVPVKGERTETTIRRLTELGVDTIVPVLSVRSVVRWDGAKAAKNHDRHLKAAREAGMQSRRVRLPVVEPTVVSVAAFLDAHPSAAIADPDGKAIDSTVTCILTGPEGGFDRGEVTGAVAVSLPGGILRAETATVVAGALMAEERRRSLDPDQ